MVKVTKRPDRRPVSHVVYKRLASTACCRYLIRLVDPTSVYAQTLHDILMQGFIFETHDR